MSTIKLGFRPRHFDDVLHCDARSRTFDTMWTNCLIGHAPKKRSVIAFVGEVHEAITASVLVDAKAILRRPNCTGIFEMLDATQGRETVQETFDIVDGSSRT